MGVDRVDYLVWGAKVDPDDVSYRYDDFEAEMDQSNDKRRFDLIYDSMCGNYAIAGRIIAASGDGEGFDFKEVDTSRKPGDEDIERHVRDAFGGATFGLYLFSHFF